MSLNWKNKAENQENDFLDVVKSATLSFIVFFGITIVATVISLIR